MLPPPAATKPKTPIALARSAGSVNRLIISDSETAETIGAAEPCTARAPISISCEPASPQRRGDVKSAIPIRNSRRWPRGRPAARRAAGSRRR